MFDSQIPADSFSLYSNLEKRIDAACKSCSEGLGAVNGEGSFPTGITEDLKLDKSWTTVATRSVDDDDAKDYEDADGYGGEYWRCWRWSW